MPPSTRVELNCNGGGTTSFWQLPTPTNRQRSTAFRQKYLPVFPRECRFGELSRATVVPFLKIGIFSSTRKEVAERLLKVPQTLLQWYATDLIQKLQVFLFFPLSQQSRGLDIVNLLLSFVPCLRSQGGSAEEASPADTPRCQRSVVDQTRASHRPAQERFLFGRWVKAISESLFNHPHIITHVLEISGVSNTVDFSAIPSQSAALRLRSLGGKLMNVVKLFAQVI